MTKERDVHVGGAKLKTPLSERVEGFIGLGVLHVTVVAFIVVMIKVCR